MKKYLIMMMSLWLSACQQPESNHQSQQQHFICKSLIEGYLKSQALQNYQFYSMQPTLQFSSATRHYHYQSSMAHQSVLVQQPRRKNIDFICQQQQQRFTLSLLPNEHATTAKQVTPIQLLQLDLPMQDSQDNQNNPSALPNYAARGL
ncbi:hypothetical protein [Acinetobacter larvae]|uniref:Lipoprotein n=1 Tax=Acinetobacter larvae TaxID=1789224 RepID=A0A1B2M3M8_9GAMM|nr:hypothetical protein [Acinetobacter larvae]AOA59798.1 hypothetical protein BFG52_00240 [Acinetobacter larvae]